MELIGISILCILIILFIIWIIIKSINDRKGKIQFREKIKNIVCSICNKIASPYGKSWVFYTEDKKSKIHISCLIITMKQLKEKGYLNDK
jgi:RNase P subunit RPR2